MPVIYCNIDMFAVTQTIRIVEEGSDAVITTYTSLDNLPTTIAQLCKEANINNIHFYGNEEYLQQIIQDTQTNYSLNYHQGQPLNIEVN